jgi:hypothetical protein
MATYKEEDRVICREISSKIDARYSGNTDLPPIIVPRLKLELS